MTKYEKLAALIHLPVEVVENEIDGGMIDILIELNEKNYFTNGCCEGHLKANGDWNSYIGFDMSYDFPVYPMNYDYARKQRYFYWKGNGENNRQKVLSDLLKWAKLLPQRNLIEVKSYTLWGKNKRNENGKWKILKASCDYKDIIIEMGRKNTNKYDTFIEEKVIKRY